MRQQVPLYKHICTGHQQTIGQTLSQDSQAEHKVDYLASKHPFCCSSAVAVSFGFTVARNGRDPMATDFQSQFSPSAKAVAGADFALAFTSHTLANDSRQNEKILI
eukprot:1560622-Amphidinium_carterae.1